jgi:cell division protein FtsX
VDRSRLEEDAERIVMIDIEEKLTQHLSQRAAIAKPRDDLAAVVGERVVVSLRLVPTPTRQRQALALVAAAVVLVAGALIAWRSNPPAFDTRPAARGVPTCIVFMNPDAREADIQRIGQRLRSRAEVIGLTLVTQQDAYDEFLRLFAEKQDIVNFATPDILPASWRVELEPDTETTRQALDEDLGHEPSVKNVSCPP